MTTPSRAGAVPGITLADLRAAAETLQKPSQALPTKPAQTSSPGTRNAQHRQGRHVPVRHAVRVLAAHSGAGASTVALTIAEQAALTGPTRLIDAADPAWSGLQDVPMQSTHVDGAWCCADRSGLRIERLRDTAMTSALVPDPLPPMSPDTLTVVDMGWSLRELHATPASWLHTSLPVAVIVTRAAAGAHPAERALRHLDSTQLEVVHAVAIGSRHEIRRLRSTAGPLLLGRFDADAVTRFPLLAHPPTSSARSGAFPRALILAARHLCDQIAAFRASSRQTSEHAHQPIEEGTSR